MNKRYAFCLTAVIITAVGEFFLSPVCAVATLVLGVIVLTVMRSYFNSEMKKISALTCDVEQILTGNDEIMISGFEEGQVGILKSEVRKMTTKLREQTQALMSDKEFLKDAMADISHQLRTPLTSMNLIVSLMKNPKTTRTEQIKYLRELGELLDKTEWLISDMLEMSRFDAGVVTFSSECVNVYDMIKSAVSPIEIPLELRGIEFCNNVDKNLELVCDKRRTEEALLNIIKNCMEHTPCGGVIRVSSRLTALYTEITISDSGSGFSKEELPRVFERFFGRSTNGYGIGLALSKRIVCSQNGYIEASNGDVGAMFTVKFFKGTV